MKPKQTSKREWEKEFDNKFVVEDLDGDKVFISDWGYNGEEGKLTDGVKAFISSLLQSFADEVREKVIEDCLHDFHGAIDISNIVDYDEAKQALSTLNKRYGIKNKDENN